MTSPTFGRRSRAIVRLGVTSALVALLVPGARPASAAEATVTISTAVSDQNIGSVRARTISGNGLTLAGYYVDGVLSGGNIHAMIWSQAGGLVDLVTLPAMIRSYAYGVNVDGTAAAGRMEEAGGTPRAFLWTPSGGMEDIGTLAGGSRAIAYGISGDGTAVAGYSENASGATRAFRWTRAGGMVDLGVLSGGAYAEARAISGNGAVVTGYSNVDNGGSLEEHAFRWDAAGLMEDLGNLGGQAYSYGNAINGDGSVIVGGATVGFNTHAFRWTRSTGMVDIGTLGLNSNAADVSYDGSVAVGDVELNTGGVRGFRWTATDGMITVDDWLRASGVTLASDMAYSALSVSDDGNTVFGDTINGKQYIARVVPPAVDATGAVVPVNSVAPAQVVSPGVPRGGSGIIEVSEYLKTVAAAPNVQYGLNNASTVMSGAQGLPMRNLLDVGRSSLSATSDIGYSDSAHSRGGLFIGDFAYGYGIAEGVTARMSFGGTFADEDLATGGDFQQKGFYLAPEASIALGGNVYATVGAYAARGDLHVRRGYLNGTAMDYSSGRTDTDTWAAKLRLDWLNAVSLGRSDITPYTSLTYASSHADAFTETGGGFPASFDAVDDHATVARIGADLVHTLTPELRLLARGEAAYRFEEHSAATTGSIIGIGGFALDGRDIDQFWLRGGAGAEFDIAGGTASLMLNLTTEGGDPDIWLRSGWQVKF